MQFKEFQQEVLESLDTYLNALHVARARSEKIRDVAQADPSLGLQVPDFTEVAWLELRSAGMLPRSRTSIPFSARRDGVGRPTPSVCLKVPTGGGKTLLAAAAVSHILERWTRRNTGFVMWVVPNEAIYAQTRRALRNREHPYRHMLDQAGAGRVKILEKDDPLSRADTESHLCVMLVMLAAANRESKEQLRMFRDRGNVHGFFPVSDDYLAHVRWLETYPNLDAYGDGKSLGSVVKDSLGNALRVIRPIVILDEGHKSYSKLAMDTVYGFNPSFVLELSATPADRKNKDKSTTYANWLVDVRGTALDREGMVKLPINLMVRGGKDWRECVRTARDRLESLQTDADRLHANTARYIRPICLIQVERTGKDQRERGFVHAADVRDYLLGLGYDEAEIAEKTAETNELATPENQDLLSPTNRVRFIITKSALQEGWDCPFAYVLCSLAPVTTHGALTQMMGRILRQPDTLKTGIDALDECYVFCLHSKTGDVIEAIKKGLEADGMGDLAAEIREENPDGPSGGGLRDIPRRPEFKDLRIFLPLVLWTGDGGPRPLDYEGDILGRLDWNALDARAIAQELIAPQQDLGITAVKIGLSQNEDELVEARDTVTLQAGALLDPVYATRAIQDIVPNPWVGRYLLEGVVTAL